MTWREAQPNEYIRYDVARSYLHNACQYIGSNGGLELKCRFDHEKTTTVPQWIPCSERLPTEDGLYLVTTSKGQTQVHVFSYNGNSEEYWMRCNKAWMEMPEPWKGSEQDDR